MRKILHDPMLVVTLVLVILTSCVSVSKVFQRRTQFEHMDCEEKLLYSSDTLKSMLVGNFADSAYEGNWKEFGLPWLRLVTDTASGTQALGRDWQSVFDERCLRGVHFDVFDSLFIRGVDEGYFRQRMEENDGNYFVWIFVAPGNRQILFKDWRIEDDIRWRPSKSN